MELTKIKKRFSKIYIIVNIVWYLNIAFTLFFVFIFLMFTFSHETIIGFITTDLNSFEQNKQILHVLQNSPEIIYVNLTNLFLQSIFVLSYLYYIRHVVARVKNGEIFSKQNFFDVKKVFLIYISFYIIMMIAPSITSIIIYWIAPIEFIQNTYSSNAPSLPTSIFFLWILYEIFKVSFEYKKENDLLKEENNLTI